MRTSELTCVDVGVLLHVRLLVESLAAVLTGVGPGVRVDQQVRREGGGAFERFAALLALKDLLHAVHGPATRSDFSGKPAFSIRRTHNYYCSYLFSFCI
jgi:hypothetical protein